MSRGVGSRGTWYTFICNLSKCQTEIPDNCNVVIIVGVDYYSPEKHSNPLVIYKDPPKTMALNESTQADGRSSLMGQQLDDNEIQEILKSGTGTNELTPLPIKLPSITIRFFVLSAERLASLLATDRTRLESRGKSIDRRVHSRK